MRIYIDLDTQLIVTGLGTRTPITELQFKRGDSARIEVVYFRGVTQAQLTAGATGKFALKESGKYDAEPVVSDVDWTLEGTGSSAIYVFTPSFNTVALNTLLAHGDADDENDVATVSLMGEIEWSIDGAVYSTQTVSVAVANDVNKTEDGTPLATPSPLDWLWENGISFTPTINALTGGGANALDAIDTTDLPTGRIRAIRTNIGLYLYELQDSTIDSEQSPLIIQPDNWDISLNGKKWFLLQFNAATGAFAAGITVGDTANPGIIGFYDGTAVGTGALGVGNLTAFRSWLMPDKSGTVALVPAVVTDSTTARTITLDDAEKYIRLTNAASCTITVPPNSTTAFPIGTEIFFRIAAAGIPTITEGSGVTVNNKTALASLATHATWALKKVATDVWDLI